jgi:hypothetical protein
MTAFQCIHSPRFIASTVTLAPYKAGANRPRLTCHAPELTTRAFPAGAIVASEIRRTQRKPGFSTLRHMPGVEKFVQLVFGEVGLFAGYFADGLARLVGLLGDLGRFVVADPGSEGRSEH